MKFSLEDLKKFLDKDKIGSWIVKYKRQVAVGCILVCLIIAALCALPGSKKTEEAKSDAAGIAAEAAQDGEAQEVQEEANDLEQDAYADVNAIVQQYYDSMAAGDMDTLSSIVDEISEEEKERILRSKDIVEGYQNISCYTKKGLEEGSYLVFVYYEQKFVRIETAAPGLAPLYVCTNEDGSLYIFNGEVSEELQAYVEQMAQEEDVVALREEVKAKYEEAKAADEELVKLEERYTKVASESELEETLDEAQEETSEEDTAGEAAQEENTAQESEESSEAAAQNRETRFTESVRLRSQPSTDSEYLGTAYQGESVTQIESYSDGWSKINYNGKECYCKTEFLE
jgi:hypothetical protein